MKRKKSLFIGAAALALTVSVGSTLAYFTTYVTAAGGASITLRPTTTTITEREPSNWTKYVTVGNDGDVDCYIRVKAIVGDTFTATPNYSGSEKWSPNADGYYYYRDVVPAGGKAEELDIKIELPEGQKDDFNVIVIQECAPVLYGEDGNALSAEECFAQATDISNSIIEGGE